MPGTALWVDAFVCLPGFTCLPLSPFICLPLSPSLDDPVWVDGFICLPLSFVSRCLPAWMPGTALWVDGFICLPLSPFICLPAWMAGAARVHLSPFVSLHLSPVVSQPGCLGGQIHLSPFVSLHLSPVVSQPGSGTALWVDGFMCLPLSPSFVSRSLPAWMPGTALWVDGFICLPLSPLISPVVSQPGCLARLSGWTGSFVSLCLPSFVSRCLPAWMPGAALWVDGFICLPLSPRMSGTPLFPFICLPLSPSLDAWHCFFGGQIHFSAFVSPHLAPVVSQPGCLSRLSRRTDSLVSLGSLSFVSHLCGWTDSFVSLCLPLFVSRCLPAWMPGTALWVDGFICLPLSPSLDVWHSRSAVSFTSRGSVLLAGSGLPSALALASVIPCLADVGDRVLLCLPFIWTSISLGLVVGRLPCLSLATPCLFVQCLVISCGPGLTIAVRCGARLQLREGSVNPPVKQT